MNQTNVKKRASILALDDDAEFLNGLKPVLANEYDVRIATDVPSAMNAIQHSLPDLVLLDIGLPQISGLQVLKLLKRRSAGLPVIMLTGAEDSDTIIETMKSGANDYVIKGRTAFIDDLRFRVDQVISVIEMKRQNEHLKGEASAQLERVRRLSTKLRDAQKHDIVGTSKGALLLKDNILRLRGTRGTVLITGEHGTGKELVARNLNLQEDDPGRPFVPVNCTAIPHNLFESELFGHVKGSFTDATQDKKGLFQVAHGGDIFLDEIGDLPLELQVKLLRVLQEKVVQPIGSNSPIKVDVRVIAGTNRDLKEEVRAHRFREDLFYRLHQFVIHVPPLRERRSDIIPLAEHFVNIALTGAELNREAKEALKAYHWRGNIRELEATIVRACLLCRKRAGRPRIAKSDLEFIDLGENIESIKIPPGLLPENEVDLNSENFESYLNWMERIYFVRGLSLVKGKSRALIEKLQLSRADFFRRKRRLGLSAGNDEVAL